MSGGSDKQSSLFGEIISRFGGSSILGPTRTSSQRESIGIPWFPECRLGVLCHDEDKNRWHQSAPGSDPEENLIINIQDNGVISLHPGDDDGQYLRTSIHSADELLELMNFFESADADNLHPENSSEIPLAAIIDKVCLLIPGDTPKSARLIELTEDYLRGIPEKLAESLDAHFASHKSGNLANFSSEQYADLPRAELLALDSGNLVFDVSFGWRTAGEFLRNAQPGFGEAPSLSVRLKDSFSKMYFSDFVRLMPEGSALGAQLTAGWKQMSETLKKIHITAPSNKADQVARSVSLRSRAARSANMA